MSDRATPKDPAMAAMLSFVFPGLGHLYAGKPFWFLVLLGLELWFFSMDWWMYVVVLHVFQTIAAGGAAKLWNREHAAAIGIGIPPPPIRRGGTPVELSPIPPPPRVPEISPRRAPASHDAEGLLAELSAAWSEHRRGDATAREFADRKWRAIRAVRVADPDEAGALVAAARELSAGGVLTSEEVAMLAAQVGA